MQFDNARKIACFTTNIIEPQKSLEFQRKTALQQDGVKCGSGNWTRTSDIRINSPLFYRLNYARIANRIIYQLSAEVKTFFKNV